MSITIKGLLGHHKISEENIIKKKTQRSYDDPLNYIDIECQIP